MDDETRHAVTTVPQSVQPFLPLTEDESGSVRDSPNKKPHCDLPTQRRKVSESLRIGKTEVKNFTLVSRSTTFDPDLRTLFEKSDDRRSGTSTPRPLLEGGPTQEPLPSTSSRPPTSGVLAKRNRGVKTRVTPPPPVSSKTS